LGILGVLQYRWLGEVSEADRERRQGSLRSSLARVSQEFNSEIAAICRQIIPVNSEGDTAAQEEEIAARYGQWKKSSRHGRVFRRIAIATASPDHVARLRALNLQTEQFEPAEWPEEWTNFKQRMEARFGEHPRENRGAPGPPFPDESTAFETPLFGMSPPGPHGQFERRQGAWMIFELELPYVRDVLLPELLQRHLGSGGSLDYQVEVVSRSSLSSILYVSDPQQAREIVKKADASVSIFSPQMETILLRRWGPQQGRGRGPMLVAPGGIPRIDMGRWQMYVRHRAGSLETVVARARARNLAVAAGVLLLMLASAAALIRYTRRAQRLAELQLDFVAGVSHELRTPLTVIRTAAYNLRGKLAANPAQVERYGALIQEESGRLKDLVEQILRFASVSAGRTIQQPEEVSIEAVIDDMVAANKAAIEGARFVLETKVEPELPPVLGDATALKHALQNLLSNAAKYGTQGNNWIGVFAAKANQQEKAAVEIRVADHGPGIPPDEQAHVFDPFFRGRRAIQDQIHGTGLGLNLVKRIVEAHGGTIRVKSEPAKGTEFIVRIPAAPAGVM
jgi:signal transduction histidine kinase